MKDDEFWDFERQVDLEAFSAPTLYDILSKQARSVTRDLGKQKEEVKALYMKISNQTESLKGLWSAKLNLNRSGMATEQDVQDYDSKLEELETELERRKALGSSFEKVLARMKELHIEDEKFRKEHQVTYHTRN